MSISNFIEFLSLRYKEILALSLEHLWLSMAALGLAIVIGLSIGILLTRYVRLSGGVLGVLGVIQTIPSLALLGLMIPFLGIGAMPAILALFLYALLPVVRNTYTGITGVDQVVKDAARGMGMTSWQILKSVELPLALPVIFAGIRTAAVINIGVATLCALIAAGGLGEFIFRGISLNDSRMVLAGALPAALLALLVDGLLAWIQSKLNWIVRNSKLVIWSSAAILVTAFIANQLLSTSDPSEILLALDTEFLERPDGYRAMRRHYDFPENINTLSLEQGLMYQALHEHRVDVIGGYSTEGRIKAYDLKIIEDDKGFFPPYYVAPIIRSQTAQKYPQLVNALEKLHNLIPDTTMQRLNYAVDGLKEAPREVARNFLKAQGFRTQVTRNGKADIVIGGKKFTEQYILIHLFKILIENYTSLTVDLKGGLAGTQVAFEALRQGSIDLYPEYTGTGLFVILKASEDQYKPILQNKEKVYEFVKEQMFSKYQVQWLSTLGFNNTYAFMMNRQEAEEKNIRTISDLKAYTTSSF